MKIDMDELEEMYRDELECFELKLTVDKIKPILRKYYGNYVTYVTTESAKETFDYKQWSKPTIVNGEFINNLSFISGLIRLKVYKEEPLFCCNVESVHEMTLQSKLTEIAELDKKLKSGFPSVGKVTYKVCCTTDEVIKAKCRHHKDVGWVMKFDGYTVVLEVKG